MCPKSDEGNDEGMGGPDGSKEVAKRRTEAIRTVGPMLKKMKHSLLVFMLLFAVLAPAAYAHHSMAMFDATKTITLEGTVKEFRFSSPHGFIELMVQYKAGPIEWSIEMTGPGNLARSGWTPQTLKFGDKVKVACHPLRTGKSGCNFVSLTWPDGRVLRTQVQ
jgi:uncharacterized protein DUF6152